MTCYHYTSYKNWLSIQKHGLIPKRLDGLLDWPDIAKHFPKGVSAVWLWLARLKGMSEVGTLIWQMGSKKTPRIVLLACEVDERDFLQTPYGGLVTVTHMGSIGASGASHPLTNSVTYHEEPARLCTRIIPPEHISLEGAWDLERRLKDGKADEYKACKYVPMSFEGIPPR